MSEYRVIRLPEGHAGGHLIIGLVDEHSPAGGGASCPTGNSVEELRYCLEEMLDATRKDVIAR